MDMILDKQHIILYVSLAIAPIGETYLIADKHAESARTEAAVAKAQMAQIVSANTQFQSQVTAQIAQLEASNQALQTQLAQRDKVEKSISTHNGSLTPTQVATGIQSATDANDGEATASGQFIQLDLPLGQQALSALQLVPLLQKDKADLTIEVFNDEKALVLEKQSHQSDLKADEAKLESCQADLKAVKRSTLRSKLRWLGAGVTVGFVGRSFVKV
jgi:hypothetical protein